MRAERYREVQLWTPQEAPARALLRGDRLAPRRARAVARRARAADRGVRQAAVSGARCASTSARSAIPGTRSRCSRSARRSSRAGTRRAADVAALAGARRGGGDDVRRRARVPGLPHPRARRSSRSQAAVHAARETVPSVAAFAPDLVGRRHPHRRAGARRRAVRRAGRDARAARAPVVRAGLPALLARRAAAAHRAPARWAWRRFDGVVARGPRAGPAGVQRLPRAARPAAAARAAHRPLARADARRARCRSSSTRAAGSRGCASSGRCCGSRRASGSRRRRARARWCSSRRRRRRTPGTRCCARRSPGWPRAPVRVIATYNGRAPDPAGRGARQRRARALALLRADDARLRPRRHARRPRHAGARAVVRLPGRGLPRGRRHGRERRARGLGRASACGCRGACSPRARCGSPWGARWRDPALRARARALAAWMAAHDGAQAAARELEAVERPHERTDAGVGDALPVVVVV